MDGDEDYAPRSKIGERDAAAVHSVAASVLFILFKLFINL
jgi:hypothetical protein